MFLPGHVYLFNSWHTDIIFTLNHDRDISIGSMRRGATVRSTVLLKRARAVDITEELKVDHDTALRAVKTAPDYVRWKGEARITLIDGDDQAHRAINGPARPDMPATGPIKPPSLNPPRVEAIRAQLIARAQRDAAAVQERIANGDRVLGIEAALDPSHNDVVLTKTSNSNNDLASSTDIATTSSGTTVAAPQGEPSITWKREQLVAYATALGLKILPTHNKAATLRKIREAARK